MDGSVTLLVNRHNMAPHNKKYHAYVAGARERVSTRKKITRGFISGVGATPADAVTDLKERLESAYEKGALVLSTPHESLGPQLEKVNDLLRTFIRRHSLKAPTRPENKQRRDADTALEQ
jgi:hypothetical protein